MRELDGENWSGSKLGLSAVFRCNTFHCSPFRDFVRGLKDTSARGFSTTKRTNKQLTEILSGGYYFFLLRFLVSDPSTPDDDGGEGGEQGTGSGMFVQSCWLHPSHS
jgi:hypothetical protein